MYVVSTQTRGRYRSLSNCEHTLVGADYIAVRPMSQSKVDAAIYMQPDPACFGRVLHCCHAVAPQLNRNIGFERSECLLPRQACMSARISCSSPHEPARTL
jgi:hypothetical protein